MVSAKQVQYEVWRRPDHRQSPRDSGRVRALFAAGGAISFWQRAGFVHDLVWAFLAPAAAVLLREGQALSPDEASGSLIYITTAFAVSLTVFSLLSLRSALWAYTSLGDILRVGAAVAASVILTTFIVFILNRHEGVARSVPVLHFVLLLFPLCASRVLCRILAEKGNGNGRSQRPAAREPGARDWPEHVLLVGVNRLADFYLRAVTELGDGGVEVVGLLDEDVTRHGCQLRSTPILAAPEQLTRVLQEFDVRGIRIARVLLCVPWEELSSAGRDVLLLSRLSGSIRLESVDEVLGLRKGVRCSGQAPGAVTSAPPQDREQEELFRAGKKKEPYRLAPYFAVKRTFDLAVAVPLAVLLFPLVVGIALFVGLTIGPPSLFWQKRPGCGGRSFRIYKFRTMLPPYDRYGNRIPEALRQTRASRLLRRSRLDELPQLYNILVGDMSLVGPRPLLHVDQPENAEVRMMMRPGVTGWAQVNGGIDLTPEEKLALDLWYARHASLWLDLKIIMLSLLMVLRGDRKNERVVAQAFLEQGMQ